MFNRYRSVVLILVVALLMIGGCAKRSTSWQENTVLELIKQIPVTGNPYDISIGNNNVYVALDQCGFAIVNMDTGIKTWYTSMFQESDGSVVDFIRIRNIAVVPEHNLLFVNETDGTDEIKMINISNMDTLTVFDAIVGSTQDIRNMRFRAIQNPTGRYTVEALFTIGRKINYGVYDGVANIWFGIIQDIYTPVTADGVDFDDDYFYVAANQRGLLIYERATSQLVGEISLKGEALKVDVLGDYAYVAARQGGMHVVDIRNHAAPVLVSSFDTVGYATSIDVHDNLAAVSSGSGGVYLFDITNPQKPKLMQRLTSAGYTNKALIHGNNLIVAGRDEGILIYRIDR